MIVDGGVVLIGEGGEVYSHSDCVEGWGGGEMRGEKSSGMVLDGIMGVIVVLL